jgi:hypothetical protein
MAGRDGQIPCRTFPIPVWRGVCAIAMAATCVLCGPRDAAAILSVQSTIPERYGLQVSRDLAEMWVFFNAPLAPLPAGCVRVSGTMSGLHDGSVTLIDNAIRFQNGSEPFFPGELVVVNYRSDIQNGIGEPLSGGFMFAFTIASAPAPATWSAPRIYGTASIPYFIYGGDVDEDNTPDVAAPNEGTGDVSIFLNRYGVGTFPEHEEFGVGVEPSSIFGEDFDNDGDQDLATADIEGGTISVLLNLGDGTFVHSGSYPAGTRCRQVYGGDFDGDNDVDLCATAYQADQMTIYRNNGDGTFTPDAPITVISDGPFAIRTGDLNADGHLDIAVACQSADLLDVFLNDGLGGFVRTGSYLIGDGPWCLNGNDMDGDGDFDLVSVASFADQLVVLFNDGSGGFSTRTAIGTPLYPLGVFAADLDGDGDIDVTCSNYSAASVGIYMNPGNGLITLQTMLSTTIAGTYTWAHDLDGDGDLDLSTVDEEANRLFVFYNGAVPADAGFDPGVVRIDARMLVRPNPVDPERGAAILLAGITGETDVEMFDIDGSLLRRIWSGTPTGREITLPWDGRDERGLPVPGGVYFLLARAADGSVAARRDVVVVH